MQHTGLILAAAISWLGKQKPAASCFPAAWLMQSGLLLLVLKSGCMLVKSNIKMMLPVTVVQLNNREVQRACVNALRDDPAFSNMVAQLPQTVMAHQFMLL